jgi:tetratricopeptide (TPR) repeat protein
LEQALEYWPNESSWHIEAADLWKRLGNTEKPIEHLQIANLYNPQDIQIRRLLGSALLSAGKNTEALSHLVMVVESRPDDYDTWIALSELYQRTGELDLALQAANRAGEVNSKGVKARLQSARISWLKGEFRKAEELAKQAQILDPEDADIYVFLARLSKEQGNKTNALELLEKASTSKAASLNTVIEHANLINEINGAVAARDLIASFSKKYPENPDLLVLLAEAEAQCGETRNAEFAARKALDIKPDEKAIHMLLGRILETNGNLDQAAHHYSQAVRLEPKLIDGYLKLSQVYINQREFTQARKVLEQGITKVPGNVNLYLSCAALLKESKDYHGAEKMLRKASQIDPRNVIIHRQLGAILALNMVHQSQEVGSQV